MSNMSYCRFRNTVEDVEDCIDNWDGDREELEDMERYNESCDEEDKMETPILDTVESAAQLELLNLAQQIVDNADEDNKYRKTECDTWELA